MTPIISSRNSIHSKSTENNTDNIIWKHGFQNHLNCMFLSLTEQDTWTKFAGKFWTSVKHTSHFLFPFVLNHLIKHSSCTNLWSPLQLHSILKIFLSSNTSRHILHTASSSVISSLVLTSTGTGVIWSDFPRNFVFVWKVQIRLKNLQKIKENNSMLITSEQVKNSPSVWYTCKLMSFCLFNIRLFQTLLAGLDNFYWRHACNIMP